MIFLSVNFVLLDKIIIAIFFLVIISIGLVASKTAGKNTSQYFLGGRKMPWWLLGVSMVACTFSADTPNLVTNFVREGGVAQNWMWWAFLITGMVTVFIYARLWRRSKVLTDLEFYELRYSGKAASFLRGFRAIYLGLFFNVLIMGSVSLAAIKIGGVLLGLQPWQCVVFGSIGVLIYTVLGGIKGVIWADFFQYSIAMFGAVFAAVVAVKQPEIGNLSTLLTHPEVSGKLDLIPDFNNLSNLVPLLIIPIAVQWWSVWYPGAEPGGGGYIAQRMLAAKNEKNAIGATLFFNFMHYAIRPWPWIIVALASIILYPDMESILKEFPNIETRFLQDDIAYPVMMSKLGPGWLGLVVASLIAAYMSTIGTHLNWGSSYVVNDFYKRFLKPGADEKHLIIAARLCTVILMILSGLVAIFVVTHAGQAFNILLLSGAGTGAIYLMRWFWWRINAITEIVAMFFAAVMAVILSLTPDSLYQTEILDPNASRLLIAVFSTSIVWIITVIITKPEKKEVLRKFYAKTKPGGPGWKKIVNDAQKENIDILGSEKNKAWEMPKQVLLIFIGCIVIYSSLFAIGSFIYANYIFAIILTIVAIVGTIILFRLLNKLRVNL